jgi:hypothetical protein
VSQERLGPQQDYAMVAKYKEDIEAEKKQMWKNYRESYNKREESAKNICSVFKNVYQHSKETMKELRRRI